MSFTNTTPNISIQYEDNHLLVIDKPHNVLSQGDHTGDPDVLSLCRQYLKESRGNGGNPFIGLVHRLDRPVGGLMLLAKTSKAADRLSKQLRDRLIQKTYWAVVEGNAPPNGVLTHFLQKNRGKNIVEVASANSKKAKQAILSFAKLEEMQRMSLLSVHLQTGRPHQIRVQLSAEGYPIWGDYKYASSSLPDGRTIALRAVELIFEHPVQKKEIHLKLAPPNNTPWDVFNSEL